ncbi:MAG: RhuM family protein, partial [Candidatus Gracilibacteria bacterium]|nr:RhuM family protein [Candidatus Gracilibacteria bacterium]
DSSKQNMGLTSWKVSPKGKIIKTDITTAKNYLTEDEIKKLNILVNAYLDLAEVFAMDQSLMTMQDWKERLDEFLKLSRKDILVGAGNITAQLAKEKAEKEYEKFRPLQDQRYINDFDEFVQKVKEKKKLR